MAEKESSRTKWRGEKILIGPSWSFHFHQFFKTPIWIFCRKLRFQTKSRNRKRPSTTIPLSPRKNLFWKKTSLKHLKKTFRTKKNHNFLSTYFLFYLKNVGQTKKCFFSFFPLIRLVCEKWAYDRRSKLEIWDCVSHRRILYCCREKKGGRCKEIHPFHRRRP